MEVIKFRCLHFAPLRNIVEITMFRRKVNVEDEERNEDAPVSGLKWKEVVGYAPSRGRLGKKGGAPDDVSIEGNGRDHWIEGKKKASFPFERSGLDVRFANGGPRKVGN